MFFQALILSASLEAGGLLGGIYNYSNRNQLVFLDAFYTTLEAKAKYDVLYVGGQMDCYFTPITVTNYSPFQMTFVFRAGADFGNVKLGYEHSCFHPMQPYATIVGNEIKPKYEGGYNKIFVRITH